MQLILTSSPRPILHLAGVGVPCQGVSPMPSYPSLWGAVHPRNVRAHLCTNCTTTFCMDSRPTAACRQFTVPVAFSLPNGFLPSAFAMPLLLSAPSVLCHLIIIMTTRINALCPISASVNGCLPLEAAALGHRTTAMAPFLSLSTKYTQPSYAVQ